MLTVGNVVHCAQKFKVHSVLLWEAGIHTSVAYLEVLLVKTTKAHQRLQILLGKHAVVMSINYLLEIVGALFSPSHCHICASVALPWTNVGSTFILYVWIHSILRRCLIQQIRTCQLPHQIRVRLILFSYMTSQSLFLMNKAGTEDKYDSFQTKPTVTSLGNIMLTRGDTDIKQHTFKTLSCFMHHLVMNSRGCVNIPSLSPTQCLSVNVISQLIRIVIFIRTAILCSTLVLVIKYSSRLHNDFGGYTMTLEEAYFSGLSRNTDKLNGCQLGDIIVCKLSHCVIAGLIYSSSSFHH